MARGHRKIILVPHKPGMITRWPFYVTPPRPRSRSPAAVLAGGFFFVGRDDDFYILIALFVGTFGLALFAISPWIRSRVHAHATKELKAQAAESGGTADPTSSNQLLLREYHKLTHSQASSSHRNSQGAMTAGLIILLIGGATAISVEATSAQVVAAALAAVGSTLSLYLGSTFIKAHQQALSQINHFFGQPLVKAYILEAERLTSRIDNTEKRDMMLERIVEEVLRGASQAGGALNPLEQSTVIPSAAKS